MIEPDNIIFDHTESKNSTPESVLRFAKNVIVPFKQSQIEKYKNHPKYTKYNLSNQSHALCKWDIYYAHVTDEVIDYLLQHNIHVAIVEPNMTDDLQEMDKGVNGPFKKHLRKKFVNWRASQSILQLNDGIDAEDVYVEYGLTALKTLHVKWVSNAGKYIEDRGIIADSFVQVDNNLVGYSRWNDDWILNEYKNNNFNIVQE